MRRASAWGLVIVGLPLMTWILVALRTQVSLESVLLLYLLAVVVIAVLGGVAAGLVAAVAADLLTNYYFIPPYGTLHIASSDHVVAIVVFVLVAVIVSVLVEVAARRREELGRRNAEAQVMRQIAEQPVGELSVDSVLEQLREGFELSAASLCRGSSADAEVLATAGVRHSGDVETLIPVGQDLIVRLEGPPRMAADATSMRALAMTAARAYEARALAGDAEQARTLAELDRVRSALLAAVGHDLRTPLAGVKAAVSSLRQTDVNWSDEERQELLATIEESADRLDALVSNLLDMTRIQAGAVTVDWTTTSLSDVVESASAGQPATTLEVDVPADLPWIHTDPVLLERAVANVVENALRYRPPGTKVRVEARAGANGVRLRVIDHGPGVPDSEQANMFEPFQRLDDRTQGGTGLGLAIARGFVLAVGGEIEPQETPGGGLTMVLTLPLAS